MIGCAPPRLRPGPLDRSTPFPQLVGPMQHFETPLIWEINKTTSTRDPDIVDFGSPNGPSLPQIRPEKVSGKTPPTISGGFWGEGPFGPQKIDDFWVREEAFLLIFQIQVERPGIVSRMRPASSSVFNPNRRQNRTKLKQDHPGQSPKTSRTRFRVIQC